MGGHQATNRAIDVQMSSTNALDELFAIERDSMLKRVTQVTTIISGDFGVLAPWRFGVICPADDCAQGRAVARTREMHYAHVRVEHNRLARIGNQAVSWHRDFVERHIAG